MIEVNQKNIQPFKDFSIFTIPRKMNYAGYKCLIPNKFITKNGFIRYINLSDNQKLKIKKDDEVKIVTIAEMKAGNNDR